MFRSGALGLRSKKWAKVVAVDMHEIVQNRKQTGDKKTKDGSTSSICSFIHSFQQLYASQEPTTAPGDGLTLADSTDEAPSFITRLFTGEAEDS